MGSVFRALDEKLDREVALKVILPELSQSAEFAERFALEAKALASVLHPSLAVVYAFGDHDGQYFMAQELVEGKPLHELIHATGVLTCARAAEIAAQICDGLGAIHERGIIHRDLKPPNVLVMERNGRDLVKVVDFGLAKLRHSTGLTDPNILLGTPSYMSPEQAKGDPIDARSDIYSIGVVLYEMLTGTPPFEGRRVFDLIEKHVHQLPPPPSERRAGLPAALEALVLRTLAKSPDDRFQTATELALALRTLDLPAEGAPPGVVPRHGPEGTPVIGTGTEAIFVVD